MFSSMVRFNPCFLLLLLLVAMAVLVGADWNEGDQEMEAQVMKVVNSYMLALNGLVEFSSGPNCNLSAVNVAGLSAAASSVIDQFFSDHIQGFVVIQTTAAVPNGGVVSNISVGSAAIPALSQPAIPNSAALKAYLKTYFVGFSGFFFSSPFWWMISAPVVTIVRHDPAYGGRLTAHVDANNENKGYFCSSGQRGFRIQFSRYRHVFVQEDDTWKYIHFGEDNKGMINIAPSVITQVQPVFPNGAK